jgi:hypothetical protein
MHRKYFTKKENKVIKPKQTPTMNLRPEGQTPVTISNLKFDEL